MRFDFDAQRQPVVVQLRGLRRADACLADVVVALVAEHERPVVDAAIALPILRQRVLDLEQVGEVGVGLEPQGELERIRVVVQHGDVLVEPVADHTLADHRDRACSLRDEEELRVEVIGLVSREDAERLAVRGQAPPGQEAGVAEEKALRVAWRGVDIPAAVAHEERAPVEDAQGVGHRSHCR